MKLTCLLAWVLCATAVAGAGESRSIPLFDGKTLAHWSGNPECWRVEDGAITGEIADGRALNRNEWIFWDGEAHDFDLSVEFRITGGPKANSGIQYRCQRLPDGRAAGYQADLDDGAVWLGRIYDEHGRALLAERGARVSIAPDGRRWTDVFAEPKSLASVIRKNDWNTYRVTAAASHVEVRVNGVLFSVLDDHDARAAEFGGRIAFQLHSGPGPSKIQFRDIRLTHLGRTEMPAHPEIKETAQRAEAPGIPPLGDDRKPLNLGFETGTLEGWKAEGDAWEKQPVEGDTVAARKRGNSRHAGKFWLGGYECMGDKGTGTLTSPGFVVTQPWASFLVGGGRDPKQSRVEIVAEADGTVIQTSTGNAAENMRRVTVKLDGLVGKRIFIRIVDNGTRGWGHVNFDDFVFHEKEPAATATSAHVAGGDRADRDRESPVLWHLMPNPAKPSPVANADAQKVVADMKLTSGFQAELIAAEPDVRQPVAFCIDERGRLWVAEAHSYPNRQPEGQGRDRITILEDRDGDGVFETRKVFVEGLNLVSAIEVGFGGVWIGAAPELIFIPKDAADKPGQPRVLLDGWGFQDTHETLNSFTWGPDGWLYGNQGVFTRSLVGKPGAPDAQRIALNSGVWRYHPVRHEFEIFAHGGSNQWGLDFNSNGHLFMTHCRSFWGRGGTTHVIRNGHFWNQSNAKYAPFISATAPGFAPDLQNYLPAAARYDSGEGGAGKPGTTAVYGGHSHVGTLIYLGDNWPEIYRDHLFTHNLHGHQVNHQLNARSGSGYEALHAGYDLMFAPDPRYIAIDLQTGPDGAVYVIDWCDTQHCHNPAGEKWDRSNGRIYRVSWAETYHPVQVDLGARTDFELAQLQTHRNDWHARTARRLLQERAAAPGGVDAAAVQWLSTQLAGRPDRAETLRVLWTLDGINAVGRELAAALMHPDDIVRAWAVQQATDPKLRVPTEALVKLAKNDPSPTVRLALASALPALDPAQAWEIGGALAMHGEDKDDRFLPRMIWFGLAQAGDRMPALLELADKTPLPSLADSIRWHLGSTVRGRELLVSALATQPDELAARNLRLLAFSLKDEASAAMPATWPQVRARLAKTEDASLDAVSDEIAALFGDTTVLAKMREILGDEKQPLPRRQQAFALLKRVGDPEATPVFARLLDVPAFRSAVIPLLSRSTDPAVAGALLQRFAKFNDVDRSAALNTLAGRTSFALPLLRAVQSGDFDKTHLSALQVRQMRNLHDPAIDQLLEQTFGKLNESSEAAKASIARLKKAYESAPLWAFDARAGQETYRQICAVCHPFNATGGKLGPDLAGSWRNGLDYFLENVIDPNAVVGDNFQLNVLTKTDGSVLSGVIEQETAGAITLRTITETVIVSKSDLKDRKKLAQSVMPPGLLEALPERQAIELLKFLTSKQG